MGVSLAKATLQVEAVAMASRQAAAMPRIDEHDSAIFVSFIFLFPVRFGAI